MTVDQPRPGTARINDGPWLPCCFSIDGRQNLVDWKVAVDLASDWPAMGPGSIEIAICEGVTVFGDVVVDQLSRDWNGSSGSAMGSGPLRGVR